MKKNECAQEMLLDLVMRHGCEVKIRPYPDVFRSAIEIVLAKEKRYASAVIDLTNMPCERIRQEEIVCRIIERTIVELFRDPYREMMDKHFRKEV